MVAGKLVKAPVNFIEFCVEPPGSRDYQTEPTKVWQANGGAEQNDAAETQR